MKPVDRSSLTAWDIYVLHRLYYWTIGGVVTAWGRVTFAKIESLEFANSISLICMGMWIGLTAAFPALEPVIFNGDVSTSIRALAAILLIGIGRYGLHCMLSNTLEKRETGLLLTLTAWLPLSLATLLFTNSTFMTLLFLLAASVSAALYWLVTEEKQIRSK